MTLDVRIVFGLDTERVVHWIGNNLIILEWSKSSRGIAGCDLPVIFVFRKSMNGILSSTMRWHDMQLTPSRAKEP